LSENNNKPEIAFMNYVNFFEQQGYVLDKDVFVRLSFQNKHGNNFVLKEEF
jgi:monomeric isocitrate dehydrogenase